MTERAGIVEGFKGYGLRTKKVFLYVQLCATTTTLIKHLSYHRLFTRYDMSIYSLWYVYFVLSSLLQLHPRHG